MPALITFLIHLVCVALIVILCFYFAERGIDNPDGKSWTKIIVALIGIVVLITLLPGISPYIYH